MATANMKVGRKYGNSQQGSVLQKLLQPIGTLGANIAAANRERGANIAAANRERGANIAAANRERGANIAAANKEAWCK